MGIPELEQAITDLKTAVTNATARVNAIATALDLAPQVGEIQGVTASVNAIAPTPSA